MNRQKDDAWTEAKRRCRLNEEDVRMAKELGFQPKSLMKNIPAPSQQWKTPVNEWVRSLHQKKFGSRKPIVVPAAPKVVLFDRPSGFLVHLPKTEVKRHIPVVRIEDDDDVPF